MVAFRSALACLTLLISVLLPALNWAVKISAEVDEAQLSANHSMEVVVRIHHEKDETVDENSFRMKKQRIDVRLADTRKPSREEIRLDPEVTNNTVISIYRFSLPPQPKGLYILPSVSVRVGDQRYRSVATSYEVSQAQASSSLRLEAVVDGDPPFYPGQHAVFRYRIYYNKDIELTEEELPLLDAEGFLRVGEMQVSDYQTDTYTVQEIAQEVRAEEPGTYSFGPSILEGVSYGEDISGRKLYDKQRLRAELEPLQVEVAAFPEEGMPASFTGAVGQYAMRTKLLTPKEVAIGDPLEVGVQVTGSGEIETLSLPDVECQPGFSGRFQFGDYPPFEQEEEGSKQFIVKLRPLSAYVTEVPPVEFSFFDPKKREYQTLISEALPINVRPLTSVKPEPRAGPSNEERFAPPQDIEPGQEFVGGADWRIWLGKAPNSSLEPNYFLEIQDFSSQYWKLWQAWLAVGLALTLLMVQWAVRRSFPHQPKEKAPSSSEEALALARQHRSNPALLAAYMEDALLQLLVEKGYYANPPSSPELLSREGAVGEVREYLLRIERERFSGTGAISAHEIYREGSRLYRGIRHGRG